MRSRVIPVLTVSGDGLVRTRRFKHPSYVGDPLNAVRIFNEKEVDELFVLDISPDATGALGRWARFREMAEEAFMPMAFGGHLRSVARMEEVFRAGYEKVVLNTAVVECPGLVDEGAARFGSQSIVVSIDVARPLWRGPRVAVDRGRKITQLEPLPFARECVERGAGEILLRTIAHDGMMNGFDLDLVEQVSAVVTVPIVVTGGAGGLDHLRAGLRAGAHAVAAGSQFVYQGSRRGVLINYPSAEEMESLAA